LLSEPYAGYTFEEAEAKFDDVEKFEGGPRTCETMRFPCCDGCIYQGRIRTPLEKTLQYWEVPEIFRPLLERGFLVPDGFAMTKGGIFLRDEEGKPGTCISETPVVMFGSQKKPDKTIEEKLFFLSEAGKIESCFVALELLQDPAMLRKLFGYGIYVNVKLKDSVTSFFRTWKQKNISVMSNISPLDHQGWQDKDSTDFAMGDTVYYADGTRGFTSCKEGSPETILNQRYFWDQAPEPLLAAYSTCGSLEEWWKGVSPLLENFQIPLFCTYASFAAPLLQIRGKTGFLVELASRTSTGKTTTLRLVGSVWGNMISGRAPSIMANFGGTALGIEAFASFNADLPLFFDDTMQKRKDFREDTFIFNTVNDGITVKSRSDSKLNFFLRGKGVAIVTSEISLLKFTRTKGSDARVIPILIPPLGESDERTAQAIRNLESCISENYGILGQLYLEQLVSLRARNKQV
ncbi:MAG TPA: DUF927 domain-containing protein, partial [Synergistales bacterium]|nr:DUF927 domain-containing protein [Synergistales bacterium]